VAGEFAEGGEGMTRKNRAGKAARYGMVIDLDRCHGCGACMVACSNENNVPPPGAKASHRTGLNWMRVFEVRTGGQAAFVPVLCMQCGDETPCASVCPQNAVEVDPATGVVGQIPPRCLGCRYCMAACPYQARVFNWQDPVWPAGMERTLNPQVSVRQRGTVEKCNFCHGRWHAAREKAAAEGAEGPVQYKTACMEACPADAIEFGDLNSPEFRQKTDGAVRMLESLGTGGKVYYRSSRKDLLAELESPSGKGMNDARNSD
jgi:molybdopterin-containing oxidoreductase family iron-sulfur binding subunit